MLDLELRMLEVLCEALPPGTKVVAVEQPFAMPLIDQKTGEVLERDLVGSLDCRPQSPTRPQEVWINPPKTRATEEALLRLVSGHAADRARRYWPITLGGYAINRLAVLFLALAGRRELAAALMIAERFGTAVRTPPRAAARCSSAAASAASSGA